MEEMLKRYGIERPFCGADVGDGWHALIERLIVDLIALGWNKELDQVKEKFGRLRFYTGEISEQCRDRICEAERESARTCEVCGEPGEIKLACLCEKHWQQREAKK